MSQGVTMKPAGQLLWKATPEVAPDTPEVYIYLDPLLGLMDLDFHQLMADGWTHFKAKRKDATASLGVAPAVTLPELMKALTIIHERGGYEKIVITVTNL